MDTITIKDLVARGIIGLNDWEREKLQEIVINVTLYVDLQEAALQDDVEKSVNYKTIAKKMLFHAEHAHRFTVEALALDLLEICFENPKVEKVRMRVEKPEALRFSSSVGVEIERSRDQLS